MACTPFLSENHLHYQGIIGKLKPIDMNTGLEKVSEADRSPTSLPLFHLRCQGRRLVFHCSQSVSNQGGAKRGMAYI